MKIKSNISGRVCRVLAFLLSFLLIFEQSGFAQVAAQLDISGHLASLHQALTVDKFRPLHLRYLQYDPTQNNFQLWIDKGTLKNPSNKDLENTSKDLLKYFFIGLSLPNDAFWVNLRPDSPDNIIDNKLAQTDIGRIMLETDLQLKKDTTSATSPKTPEGREYWDKLYRKAGELFGNENVTIPTLTRPWIVPDEIIVRETTDSAYVYKATLKVMLEQDYIKDSTTYNFTDPRLKELNEYSSQLIRELIIPKLTKEVNSAKKYAALRQIYYSLIIAQWFKARYADKDTTYSRLINRRGTAGLASKENWSKTTYFTAYQKSFKDGEYNIKEPAYTAFGQVIRSYFSGGISDLSGGAGFQQALGTKGHSSDNRKIVTAGVGVPPASANVIIEEFNAESPDMVKIKVSHAQRNRELASQLEQGGVVRISGDTVSIEGAAAQQDLGLSPQVIERLKRIRTLGGILGKVVNDTEVAALAETMGITETEARQRLVAIAQDTDVFLVRNRLTLHEQGPFAHARRGISGRGRAIWLGEKLFLREDISDQDIALLMLEEAKHILAPSAGHSAIVHSRKLQEKLSAAAIAVGEALGKAFCELDTMPVPEGKVFYLPEIYAPQLNFSTVKDYSRRESAMVVRHVFEYLNTLYAEMNRETKGDIRRLGEKQVEFNPAEEEQGVPEDDLKLALQIQSWQQRLWESLLLLNPEIRRELFGTEDPGNFSQEAFDRLFLFSLPRFFASLGIFPVIEHFPLIHNDIISHNLYALDLYEIDKVEEPSVRWHRGAQVSCKKLTLGKRVSVGGRMLDSPMKDGFAGRSAYGVIVINPQTVENMSLGTKRAAQSSVFRQIAGVPLMLLLRAVNEEHIDPLAVNSAMLGVAANHYLSGKSDAEVRQESLQIVEHHEIEHVIRQGKGIFRAPANQQSSAELVNAYHDYAFHEELKARLAELLHMPPLQTLLGMNEDIRAGRQGTGAWYGSAANYIFQGIVEIVRQNPSHYGFTVVPGYPVEPQLQVQIFTLATNRKALLEIITEMDRLHDAELKQLGISNVEESPDMDTETDVLGQSALALARSSDLLGRNFDASEVPFDAGLLQYVPQQPWKRKLFVECDNHRASLISVVIGKQLDSLTDKEAYETLTRIIAMDAEIFEQRVAPLIGATNASPLQSYAQELLSWAYKEDAIPLLMGYIERAGDISTFSREYLLEHAIQLLPAEVIARSQELSRAATELINRKKRQLEGEYKLLYHIERFEQRLAQHQEKPPNQHFLGQLGGKITGLIQRKGTPAAFTHLSVMPKQGETQAADLRQKWQMRQQTQQQALAEFAHRRLIPLADLQECLTMLQALDLFLEYYDKASLDNGHYELMGRRGERLRGIGGLGAAMSREHNLITHFRSSIRDLFDEIFWTGTHRADSLDPLINPDSLRAARSLMESGFFGESFLHAANSLRAAMAIDNSSSIQGQSGRDGEDSVTIYERARRMVLNSFRSHLLNELADATDTRFNRGFISGKGLHIDEETYVMIRGHLKALAAELEKVFGRAGVEFFREALAPAFRVFEIDSSPSAERFGLDPEAAKILSLRRMPFNNGGGPDMFLGTKKEGANTAVYYGRAGRKTDGPFFVSGLRFDSVHKVVVTPDGMTPEIKSLRPADRDAEFRPELAGEKQLREALDSENPEAVLARLFTPKRQDRMLPSSDEQETQGAEESPDFGPETIDSPYVDGLAGKPSTSVTGDKMGGIDFRVLPIVTQAIGNLSANINRSAVNSLNNVNLHEEWRQIEQLVSSGITPSAERIKEFVQASCIKGEADKDRKKVIGCISDILRREEENCCHTEAMLRDILIVLEASRSSTELSQAFLGKTI